MAHATIRLHIDRSFEVQYEGVEDEDQLFDKLVEDEKLQEKVWEVLMDRAKVVSATYDEPDPPEEDIKDDDNF